MICLSLVQGVVRANGVALLKPALQRDLYPVSPAHEPWGCQCFSAPAGTHGLSVLASSSLGQHLSAAFGPVQLLRAVISHAGALSSVARLWVGSPSPGWEHCCLAVAGGAFERVGTTDQSRLESSSLSVLKMFFHFSV